MSPLNAKRAATTPFGVNPVTCKIVIFCRRLMLASATSPASVTGQYGKFICKCTFISSSKPGDKCSFSRECRDNRIPV